MAAHINMHAEQDALRAAIGHAAHVLGVWRSSRLPRPHMPIKWTLEPESVVGRYVVRRWPLAVYDAWTNMDPVIERWYVDDITAALFLLCLTLPETRETCPTCKGSTHALDEGLLSSSVLAHRARRYMLKLVNVWSGRSNCRVLLGGCPDCRPPEPDEVKTIPMYQPARGWIMRSPASILLGALTENSGGSDRSALSVLSDELISSGRCKSSCLSCRGAGHVTEVGHLHTDTERLERMFPAADGWTVRSTDDGWLAKRTCPRTRQLQALGEWLALWLASLAPSSPNAGAASTDAPDCRSALAARVHEIIAALESL